MTDNKRFINLGPYKIYEGTQSLLTIVPAAVRKMFDLEPGNKVKIILVDDGWLIIPIKDEN